MLFDVLMILRLLSLKQFSNFSSLICISTKLLTAFQQRGKWRPPIPVRLFTSQLLMLIINGLLYVLFSLSPKPRLTPITQTYDTDANFLQALDNLLVPKLLPPLLAALPLAPFLLDLGCGTGRTTTSLLSHPGATVLGLDASPAMLAIAQQHCAAHFDSLPQNSRAAAWYLEEWDMLSEPTEREGGLQPGRHKADLVVSTLVLEHIPLKPFFAAAAALVKPGGRLLVTNMHREMGEVSQAGFVDERGVKVRGESFAHGVQETVEEAHRCGFMLEGDVLEKGVEEANVVVLGQRAQKWVRGPKVWYGCVWRKERDGDNDDEG